MHVHKQAVGLSIHLGCHTISGPNKSLKLNKRCARSSEAELALLD